ncbi:hypothetical protein F4804DRAFT_324930 [Jackrogersella minutella]|nr:hypothetical protein F4804DRAFT_324930 [Jackrogersella minutella]
MLAIVALTTLLGLAEASLKTPRTALSSTTSPTAASFATITASPVQFNISTPCTPHPSNSTESKYTTLPPDSPTPISPAPASGPMTTPSPPGGNFHEIGVKYVQTTYWSCVAFPLETHCGWHQPILDAGAGGGVRCEGGGARAALRAGVVAGVVAGGLVLGI